MAKRGRPKKEVISVEDERPEVPPEHHELTHEDIYGHFEK
jgi:hypothetical protein